MTGHLFFTGDAGKYANLLDTNESNPRKIKLVYYQNTGKDSSRNYALTGRVRFYCLPGSTF